MRELGDLKVHFGKDGATWLAATGRAPYFCFSGASEAEVLSKVKKALAFYRAANRRSGRTNCLTTDFNTQKTYSARELVAA